MSDAPPIYYADLPDRQRKELGAWVGYVPGLVPDMDVRPLVDLIVQTWSRVVEAFDAAEEERDVLLAVEASKCRGRVGISALPAINLQDDRFRAWIALKAIQHVDAMMSPWLQGINRETHDDGIYHSGGPTVTRNDAERAKCQDAVGVAQTPAVLALARGARGPGRQRVHTVSAIDVARQASRFASETEYVFKGRRARGGNRRRARYPTELLEDLRTHFRLPSQSAVRKLLDRAEWSTYPPWGAPAIRYEPGATVRLRKLKR